MNFLPRTAALRAMTLMELLTVFVVISILVVMLVPAFDAFRRRAEKASCASNLRSLFTGAGAYLNDQGHWPQIPAALLKTDEQEYVKRWVEVLEPYGISHEIWICPTIQRAFNHPDFTKARDFRIDYQAMPFPRRSFAPREHATQPWFVEKADIHGNGNLLIYADGSTHELNDVRPR